MGVRSDPGQDSDEVDFFETWIRDKSSRKFEMKFNILGLFVAVVISMVSIHSVSGQPTPEANPSPIIPSKLALLYTPLVCPFFYVGKAVKAAQSVVETVTGVGKK